MNKKSLLVLISGSGSNLQAIIDAVNVKKINANITAVISSNPSAYGLERAHNTDIKTIVIDHTRFNQRKDFDAELCRQVKELKPDLIALAGFMRILSNEFIASNKGKILNIHPSLLPDFKGLNTHQRVIEAGKSVHGASVHFVDNKLDSGAVILQARIQVSNSNVDELAEKVLEQEHIIYPLAIQWFIEERISLVDNHVFIDGNEMEQPALWVDRKLQLPPLP